MAGSPVADGKFNESFEGREGSPQFLSDNK